MNVKNTPPAAMASPSVCLKFIRSVLRTRCSIATIQKTKVLISSVACDEFDLSIPIVKKVIWKNNSKPPPKIHFRSLRNSFLEDPSAWHQKHMNKAARAKRKPETATGGNKSTE